MGPLDGEVVGSRELAVVGLEVGSLDREADGGEVGKPVGDVDDVPVGSREFIFVGEEDVAIVGGLLGNPVGRAVG